MSIWDDWFWQPIGDRDPDPIRQDDDWFVEAFRGGRWGVRRRGCKTYRSFADGQEALRFADQIARRKKVLLTVYRRDGMVDFKADYRPRMISEEMAATGPSA